MAILRPLTLLALLLPSILVAHADQATAETAPAPAAQIADTMAGKIYLEQAREMAGQQSDRELLINVLARLLQVEAKLNAAEINHRDSINALRSGVQNAFTQVGWKSG